MYDIYGVSDMFALFEEFRLYIQEYMFDGPRSMIDIQDYIMGMEETKLKNLYSDVGFFDGREVSMDDYVGSVFNEESNWRMHEHKGIYTGAISKENIAKVRFINSKNYVNRNMDIDNGDGHTTVPVSPTIIFDSLTTKNVTNGI